MCELLGMSANVPTDLCFSLTGLMRRGGHTGPHGDGWGAVFHEGRGYRAFHDADAGCRSEIGQFLRNNAVKSRLAVCHIRRANRGRVTLANTHPFVRELWGRPWSFAHNGQLKGVKKRPLTHYRPMGTTDSEHAFCLLLGQLRDRWPTPPSPTALRLAIEELAGDLARLGVFNMLLSEGRFLFAYRTSKLVYRTRRAPFGVATLIDDELSVDFAALTLPTDVVTTIASCPLTCDEMWTEVPKHKLLVFRDGDLVGAQTVSRTRSHQAELAREDGAWESI